MEKHFISMQNLTLIRGGKHINIIWQNLIMHAARYLHYPKLYPIDLFMAKVLGQQEKRRRRSRGAKGACK